MKESGGAGGALFVVTIFTSAFCIFLIQPMVGKRILPWFGGAPAVWTLCLAFYQSTLFLGYAYAHLLIRFARPSHQLGIHAAAVAAALTALPVLPSDVWKPEGAINPTVPILAMLLSNVALPFILLASTGPLVQAWFSRRYPARTPYPLYAVSNVGSMLALLAYPLWIEPLLPLSETSTLWSIAFAATAAAALGCAAIARSASHAPRDLQPAEHDEKRVRPTPAVIMRWLLLSGTAVILLMGATNRLCLDVASVPFLWILPLMAYLASFIISFASERTYRRAPYIALFGVALWMTLGGAYWMPGLEPKSRAIAESVYVQIPSICVLLFAGCMIMHGELFRLRPPARSLTGFYLCVSLGGALGGIFVGIVAPLIFSNYFEFELGIALVLLLWLAACVNDPMSILSSRAPGWRWTIAGGLTVVALGLVGWPRLRPDPNLRLQQRGFFGVVRVRQIESNVGDRRVLTHGSTTHGMQYQSEPGRKMPTSYYGSATGVGLALELREPNEASRIGVIGLGVGTLAAYGRANDFMRFYEINPIVVRIARDSGEFSYLKDSAAQIEVVLGDARISLAEEQARGAAQNFDMLIVDAFNSDTVPVHLMTREAFEHYVAALAPGGLLAIHLSNRHFELTGLAARMGLEAGLASVRVLTRAVPERQSLQSKWVILGRDQDRIQQLERKLRQRHRGLGLPANMIQTRLTRLADVRQVPIWTDDYSDLFSLLKRKW